MSMGFARFLAVKAHARVYSWGEERMESMLWWRRAKIGGRVVMKSVDVFACAIGSIRAVITSGSISPTIYKNSVHSDSSLFK